MKFTSPKATCRTIGRLLVLLIGTSGLYSSLALATEPAKWQVGDVFIGIGDGSYKVFDQKGGLKQTLRDKRGGYTTDCGFSPDLGQLYTANYTRTKVVVFDQGPKHEIIQTIHTDETSPGGHSSGIVFDAAGNFYVGHPDGNHLIHKYNNAGMLMETFNVQI